MGRTWKDQKSETRKPTKKERRELERIAKETQRSFVWTPTLTKDFKSSYKQLKIEE